jgi:hypothetical protein
VTPLEFVQQISVVENAIIDSLEANPPKSELRAPKDWPALRATVRAFAEDLILSDDVKKAIDRLKQDHATLLGVLWLTSEAIPFESRKIATKRAFAEAPVDMSTLPCYAFCSFLIELCDGLELV